MSSVGAAKKHVAKNSASIYVTDYRKRLFRMEKAIAKVLLEEMATLEQDADA